MNCGRHWNCTLQSSYKHLRMSSQESQNWDEIPNKPERSGLWLKKIDLHEVYSDVFYEKFLRKPETTLTAKDKQYLKKYKRSYDRDLTAKEDQKRLREVYVRNEQRKQLKLKDVAKKIAKNNAKAPK